MNDELIVEAIRSVRMTPADRITSTAPVAPVASPDAIARFQAVMDAPAVERSAKVHAIPFADQLAASWRAAQENRQEMLHRIEALTALGAKDVMSAAQLAELQYEVANLSFQQEIVSKVADKASNAVQTLIKNQ